MTSYPSDCTSAVRDDAEPATEEQGSMVTADRCQTQAKRLIEQRPELAKMLRHLPGGGRGRGRTAGIKQLPPGTELVEHPSR